MPEDTPQPPAWDDVEKHEKFSTLTPAQKIQTLQNWSKAVRDHGEESGAWDNPDVQKSFQESTTKKLKQFQSDLPKTDNPFVAAAGEYLHTQFDFERRIPAAIAETAGKQIAGAIRMSKNIPIVPVAFVADKIAPGSAEKAADYFTGLADDAKNSYGVDPSKDASVTSSVAQVAGGMVANAPAILTGDLPVMVGQQIAGGTENEYQQKIQQGESKDKALGEATLESTKQAAISLPLYMAGGKVAGMLGDLLPNTTPQLAKYVTELGVNFGANTVSSAAVRGIEAGLKGKDVKEAMLSDDLPTALQDLAFAGYHIANKFKADSQNIASIKETLSNAPLPILQAAAEDPEFRKTAPYNPALIDQEIATRKAKETATKLEDVGATQTAAVVQELAKPEAIPLTNELKPSEPLTMRFDKIFPADKPAKPADIQQYATDEGLTKQPEGPTPRTPAGEPAPGQPDTEGNARVRSPEADAERERAYVSAWTQAEIIAKIVAKGQPTIVFEAARDAAFDNARGSIDGSGQFNPSFMRKSAMSAAGKGAKRTGQSLDEPINEDGTTRGDLLPDEKTQEAGAGVDRTEGSKTLQGILGKLSDREREVVESRELVGDTFEEIGNRLGISKQAVQSIHAKAMDRMKKIAKESEFTNEQTEPKQDAPVKPGEPQAPQSGGKEPDQGKQVEGKGKETGAKPGGEVPAVKANPVIPPLEGKHLKGNPLNLVVAIKHPRSGSITIGKKGDLHYDLPYTSEDVLGFATPDGKFLTREEAAQATKDARQIAKDPVEVKLHSGDIVQEAPKRTFKTRPAFDDFGGDSTPVSAYIINDLGGLISKSSASKYQRGNGALWDDVPLLSHPTHNKVYKPNGVMPDRAAQGLYDAGLISEPTTQAMWKAIKEESKTARNAAKGEGIDKGEKQFNDFHKDRKTKGKGDEKIKAEDLKVGDTVTIGTENLKVTDIDPDTFDVTLEDGKKYGVQMVADGDVIYGIHEEAPPVKEGEMNLPDARKTEAQLAEEKRKKDQADAIAEEQNRRLIAPEVEIQQDMLGKESDVPLFDQKKKQEMILWGRKTGDPWIKLTDNTSNAEMARRQKDGWEVLRQEKGTHPDDILSPPKTVDGPKPSDAPEIKPSSQAMGIVPVYLPLSEAISGVVEKAKRLAGTVKPKEEIAKVANVIENKATLIANQITNGIRRDLGKVMQRKNNVPKQIDAAALGQMVEAGGTREGLQELLSKIAGKSTTQAFDLRKAIEHAIRNFDILKPIEEQYRNVTKSQIEYERLHERDVPEHPNYVPHYQDLETSLSDPFTGTSPSTGFEKERTYATFSDSVAAGIKPRSLNALDLLESRIKRGLRVVGRKQFIDSGFAITDATTGKSVIAPMETIQKKSGGTETVPPKGYVKVYIGGTEVAVHEGYAGLYSALTGESLFGRSVGGRMLAKTVGGIKHGLLFIDTFHLGRLAVYQAGFAMGERNMAGFNYKKPLLVVEHTVESLKKMAADGDITKDDLSDILKLKSRADMLVNAGLNIGGVQKAMFSSGVRNIPLVGTFNKFLFEKFQRSAMLQSASVVMEGYSKTHPEWTEMKSAREAAKDVNTRFGNLQKEGVFKSKAWQEVLQLCFLAPSWNEGLIRSELRGGKQLVQSAVTLATKRRLESAGLAKNMVALTVGTLAANQIVNYITRGQSTFQNEEEGADAKISAYIPDFIGSGPGFFLNPLSLPAEYAEQLITAHDRSGNWAKAASDVLGYKLGPAARAIEIFRTGRAPLTGKKLNSEADYAKEIGTALLPFPIQTKSVVGAGHSIGNFIQGKENTISEDFPGQLQKQLFSSGGIKLQNAPSNIQRVQGIAQDFKRKNGIDVKDFGESDYAQLRRFLLTNNGENAREELQKILENKTMDQVNEYFKKYPSRTFMQGKQQEERFHESLNDSQKKAYHKALEEKEAVSQKFFSLDKSDIKEIKQPEPNARAIKSPLTSITESGRLRRRTR